MASKGFVYRGNLRTSEDVSRRAKKSSGLYESAILDGFTAFKPKEGENAIRILPFTWEDTDKWGASWEIFVWVHNNIGPDRGTFICLDKMRDEPCPICEARRSSVDDEERYAMAPNEKPLIWLIDRNDEQAGPQWWLMPLKKVFKVINARSQDKKTKALLLVDDPEDGYDVYFIREGTGQKTDYTGVDVDREPSPLHENEKTQAKWLAYINENPLPEILNYQEAEHIEKVMSGRVAKKSDDEEDESDNAKPARSRRRPAAEEEEETAPARTTRRRPVEAEEEPAAEEAEAATPRRTNRSRASAEPEEEEAETRPSGRTGRRSSPEPEEEEVDEDTGEITTKPVTSRHRQPAGPEEEEIPSESRRARAGLEKLRSGRR